MEIFDWEANSKKVYETKSFSTRRYQAREHIELMKYLIKQSFNKREIFDFIQKTNSLYVNSLDTPEEQIQELENFWLQAKSAIKIGVTQKELDYINTLECKKFIKRFFIYLLCLYRSKEKRNPFFFKEKEINFGLKKAIGDTRTRFERTQAELVAANKKYDFYDVFIRNGQSCLSLKKIDTNGEVVSYIGSIEKVEKILFEKTCPVCGKEFLEKSNSKTELCEDCYKEYRTIVKHKNRYLSEDYNQKIANFLTK